VLANFSVTPIVVPKSTVIGLAEPLSETLVKEVNETRRYDKAVRENSKNNSLFHKLLAGKLDHLSADDKGKLEPVLRKYAKAFHDEESNDFKATNVVEHQIILQDTTPVRRPQYRKPFALRGEMKAQVESMLEKGIIRESTSPWSAPDILVPKKSRDGKP
jgi:hypothetical protein